MIISWSEAALIEVDAMLSDLRLYSAGAADRMETDIKRAVRQLSSFPHSGRSVPEAEDTTIRELVLGRYRLLYRVSTEEAQIIALHPAAIPLK